MTKKIIEGAFLAALLAFLSLIAGCPSTDTGSNINQGLSFLFFDADAFGVLVGVSPPPTVTEITNPARPPNTYALGTPLVPGDVYHVQLPTGTKPIASISLGNGTLVPGSQTANSFSFIPEFQDDTINVTLSSSGTSSTPGTTPGGTGSTGNTHSPKTGP